MTDAERDACRVSAILRHLNNQRLPKLLAMKERLNCGERVDQEDMRYLHDCARDTLWVRDLCEGQPALRAICNRVTQLFKDITEQALQNETLAH